MDIRYLENIITQQLSTQRVTHVKGVALTAKKLAQHWKCDSNLAYIAGLLHDITKEMSPRHHDLVGFSEEELQIKLFNAFPSVWHAFFAPIYIAREFNISDTDILNAVKYHTTGAGNMSDLEKILFISDFIEPSRTYIEKDTVVEIANRDLNRATYEVAKSSLCHVISKDMPIHPKTLECYNYYCKYRHLT